MQDRIPTKPHRYAVYDDNHVLQGYQYHERADEPTEVGTPLNKATFLKDTTCTAYGKPITSVPDEIFIEIQTLLSTKAKIETGSYTGTGTYGSSNQNSLTFNFAPKLLFIYMSYYFSDSVQYANNIIFIKGIDFVKTQRNYSIANAGNTYPSIGRCNVTFNNKIITWYSTHGADYQFNDKINPTTPYIYHYVAIG